MFWLPRGRAGIYNKGPAPRWVNACHFQQASFLLKLCHRVLRHYLYCATFCTYRSLQSYLLSYLTVRSRDCPSVASILTEYSQIFKRLFNDPPLSLLGYYLAKSLTPKKRQADFTMRASALLLALPVLATAQQFPFFDQVKEWFGKAAEAVPSAVSSVIDPAATKAARNFKKREVDPLPVERITTENHLSLLKPVKPMQNAEYEEWIVLVTGGNKTCFGQCERAEQAFNDSIPAYALTYRPLHLGILDCEAEPVLCNAWMVNVPSIMYMFMPHPLWDQTVPDAIVRYINVNRTSVSRLDLTSLLVQRQYQATEPYEGFFHPFNGPLAKFGLSIPLGYALWGFSKVPSWLFMVAVSFISRTFM